MVYFNSITQKAKRTKSHKHVLGNHRCRNFVVLRGRYLEVGRLPQEPIELGKPCLMTPPEIKPGQWQ